ncbi:MAG: serine/threonine-protein kinase, partial [Armatimonadia bacterium]
MIGTNLQGFQILREIGHGGMGVVYEAQQSAPQRRVAIKVLPANLAADPAVAARFADEANKMARLEGHPNIARVYSAGQAHGVSFLAMQLLQGDLEQRLRAHGALPLSDAANIAAQVAEALDYAHQRGVIHRDVKPANIMFDEQGRPLVTDFGIAKAMDEYRLTSTGMTLGTPQYASPEQVRGNPLDGRSDLYSLGIVLYEMVTGRLPFESSTPMGFALKHINEPPRRPGDLVARLPVALEQIILRCLAKEPHQRYGSGRELAAALRALQLPRVVLQSGYSLPATPQQTVVTPAAPPPPAPASSSNRALIIALAVLGGLGLLMGVVALAITLNGHPAYQPPPPPPAAARDNAQPIAISGTAPGPAAGPTEDNVAPPPPPPPPGGSEQQTEEESSGESSTPALSTYNDHRVSISYPSGWKPKYESVSYGQRLSFKSGDPNLLIKVEWSSRSSAGAWGTYEDLSARFEKIAGKTGYN